MSEDEMSYLTKQAFEKGFMVMPFAFNDAVERELRMKALDNMLREKSIRDFVMEHVIDHLTYVRDYLVRKSINFMVIAKDMKGHPIGVAHFIYSKSSNFLYLKDYVIRGDAETDKKMILAFMLTGAKDYMAGYGFTPNAILSSPSVKKKDLAAVNFMREMGMKFMMFEPKVEDAPDAYKKSTALSEHGNEILVFPVKKGDNTDMHVLMAAKFTKGKFTFNDEKIEKFLADLKSEDELHALYVLLSDSKFTVSLRKIDEVLKLVTLYSKLTKTN